MTSAMNSAYPNVSDMLESPAPARQRKWRTLLVATDGHDSADDAWSAACALRERTGAAIHAIAIAEPAPIVLNPDFMGFDSVRSAASADESATAVRSQIERFMPLEDCPFVVRTGPVAEEVQRYARDIHADLILTGRGRHGALERLFGEVHLMRLLRSAPCPVLAVDQRGLPRRVVIGIDFSESNLELARTAIDLATADASIYLVHVKPDPPFGMPHPGRWLDSYDDGVRAGLEHVRSAIGLPRSRVIETIVVHGHPGAALTVFAQTAQADLIAVGLQGAGFMDRLVIGSVTSHLVRTAPCSLLLAPANTA